MKLALALVCAGWPALAETPLSGAAFDALTQGKTMTYARDGQVWGSEQYLADRQVLWAFAGEDCKRGFWREAEPGLICFSYQDDPLDLECWRFFTEDGQLTAQSMKEPGVAPLAVVAQSDAPLSCIGPEVGV